MDCGVGLLCDLGRVVPERQLFLGVEIASWMRGSESRRNVWMEVRL